MSWKNYFTHSFTVRRDYLKKIWGKDTKKIYNRLFIRSKKQRNSIDATKNIYLSPKINWYTKRFVDEKTITPLYKASILRGVNIKSIIQDILILRGIRLKFYGIQQEYGISRYGANFYAARVQYEIYRNIKL